MIGTLLGVRLSSYKVKREGVKVSVYNNLLKPIVGIIRFHRTLSIKKIKVFIPKSLL